MTSRSTSTPAAQAPLWNRLPRWLRQTRHTVADWLHLPSAYKPEVTELHSFFPPTAGQPLTFWRGVAWQPEAPLLQHIQPMQPGQHQLDAASFQFALNQVPAVERVTFSGWGEPVIHADLPSMVTAAVAFSHTVTQVYSHGLFQPQHSLALLQSPIDHWIIQLIAPTPSLYSALTHGAQLAAYTHRLAMVETVLQQRQTENPDVVIDLAMVVDTMTVFHLEAMIEQAARWGADGIVLESRLALPDAVLTHAPSQNQVGELGMQATREEIRHYRHEDRITLYDNQQRVMEAIQQAQQRDWPIRVVWPEVYQYEVPTHGASYGCTAPSHTFSVQPNLAITNCPRQMAIVQPDANVWEPDAWHSSACNTLRAAHAHLNFVEDARRPTDYPAVPLACHWCPRHP